MSGIGFCIDCGHSRKATRPPCARNRALRVENNCVSRESAFGEKNGEFPKMGAKKYFHPRQEHIFPESEKKSGGNRRSPGSTRSIKRYRVYENHACCRMLTRDFAFSMSFFRELQRGEAAPAAGDYCPGTPARFG